MKEEAALIQHGLTHYLHVGLPSVSKFLLCARHLVYGILQQHPYMDHLRHCGETRCVVEHNNTRPPAWAGLRDERAALLPSREPKIRQGPWAPVPGVTYETLG